MFQFNISIQYFNVSVLGCLPLGKLYTSSCIAIHHGISQCFTFVDNQ